MKNRYQNQLKNYRWRGISCTGKPISGQLLAINDNEVIEKLKAQHIHVKKLKRRNLSLYQSVRQRIKRKDITLLTRQLATILVTGMPVTQALKLVADNHRKAEMKSILQQIIKSIESGTPLSNTLRATNTHFDSLYIALVATGELSGKLGEIFERIATYREKSDQLRAKIMKALIYPTMVLTSALAVTYLMLTIVIPEFETMFSGFGAQLPWFTSQVLTTSHWLKSYSGIIFFDFLILILFLGAGYHKSLRIQLLLCRLSLKIPIIGPVISKASIAKFSRTLATSFSAGIPILSSLKASAKTANNIHYQYAIDRICNDTAAGMPIYLAMRDTEAFPEMVLQMVMIGEESGRLDDMLNKIATIYEFEIDNTVDNLGKILEPIIIVFLGLIVGSLVVAMYLPIFNLMNVLG